MFYPDPCHRYMRTWIWAVGAYIVMLSAISLWHCNFRRVLFWKPSGSINSEMIVICSIVVKCNCAATCLPVSKQDGGEPQADRNRKGLIQGRDRQRQILRKIQRNKWQKQRLDSHIHMDIPWTSIESRFSELSAVWMRREGHPPGASRVDQGSVEPLQCCCFLICTWLPGALQRGQLTLPILSRCAWTSFHLISPR